MFTRTQLKNQKLVAELKVNVLTFSNPNNKYLEAIEWNSERALLDSNYADQPSVWAGFYTVKEIGDEGREVALEDFDGNVFCVYQDHVTIIM